MLKKKIDNSGLPCPQPVVNTKKALEDLVRQQIDDFILTVIVDNDVARENVARFVTTRGFSYSVEKKEHLYHIAIEPKEKSPNLESKSEASEAEKEICSGDKLLANTVYLLKSKTLGAGSDELGELLMRGFIFALKETDPLPAKMIFMNSAVYLTTSGSPVLDELKEMETLGMEVLSCGTCLDYFQLKDELAVGKITNMYDAVESLNTAAKCISI